MNVAVRPELAFFCRLLALLLVLSPGTGLSAQTTFHEPFDYSPPGADLLGQGGGTGFLGPWYASGFNAPIHDSHDIAAGSLSLDGGDGTGGRVRSASTNAISGVGRDLLSPIGTNDFATFYWSFLVRPEGTLGGGALNGFFGVYLDGTGDSDLFVGKPGSDPIGRYVLENRGGAQQVQSGASPVIGETALLVVRADMRPGPDAFTLYVNPNPCLSEPATGTVKSDLDLGDVASLVIYSTGEFSLDELRAGFTFESVVTCAANEPFAYPLPGADLLGQNGGTGFAGPWFPSGLNASIHDSYDIAGGSLGFGGLAVTGNRMQSAPTDAIAGLGRNLAAPIASSAVATKYFSLLLRPEGGLGQGAFNGFFGAYLDGTANAGDADLFVGKPGSAVVGRYVLENRGGAGQVQSPLTPVVGETALLVVRAELRPGPDRFTLHVNPDPCMPEPDSGTVKTDLDLGDVNAIVIYSTGGFSLDELRLGSSFDGVVRQGATCAPPGGSQLPADCNQDGTLDLSDGVCLLTFLFLGTIPRLPCGDGSAADPANVTLLDSNGDAMLDLSDAVRVLGYLFVGTPPPVLGTSCTPIVGCPDGPGCDG